MIWMSIRCKDWRICFYSFTGICLRILCSIHWDRWARSQVTKRKCRFPAVHVPHICIHRIDISQLYLVHKRIIFACSDECPEQDGSWEFSHEGIDVPQDERRWKLKNLSCGVVFVDIERSDRMECRASGRITSHWESRQIFGLERKTESFPNDTIVSFHLRVTNRVVGCGFACCYASLRQVFLEFL